MHFHQRRFFAYLLGAPHLHTLNSLSSLSYTLVTTDQCVSLLTYGDDGYRLQKLEMIYTHDELVDIVSCAAIERPAALQVLVAVAYAAGDSFFLQIVAYHDASFGKEEAAEATDCGKFELEAPPACMFRVQAAGPSGDIFYGVMVCCTDVVMAFGYIENEKDTCTTKSTDQCIRLDNDQLAMYFPEFATFLHTILAVDVFTSPNKDQQWIAFGCTDGLVRVLHGAMHKGCFSGPCQSKDLQQNGPVTSVALFPQPTVTTDDMHSTWRCNLLVTCAIGQAVVYEDLYNTFNQDWNSEVLMNSDHFDSIFVGITADIDLDGTVELLLGTDSEVMLAYKESEDGDSSYEAVTKESGVECHTNASPTSHDSSHNIWDDVETMSAAGEETCPSILAHALTRRRKWQRLPRSHWDLETFGYIYSLLWRDVNHDGVPELIIASSTGIYVYEADPVFVIDKLQRVLAALEAAA